MALDKHGSSLVAHLVSSMRLDPLNYGCACPQSRSSTV